MRSTLQEELDGVVHWAVNNNLRFNTAKSVEKLIPRGGRWRAEVPPFLAMERVGSLRFLGVTIASDLSVYRLMLMPCSMQERAPSMHPSAPIWLH